MSLSDREQKLLDQMEQALASEDPKFASALRGSVRMPKASANLGSSVLVAVAGIAALIASVVMNVPLLGILGFVAIVIALYLGFSAGVTGLKNIQSPGPTEPKSPQGFIQGFEQRWDRRQENQ